MLRRRFLPPCVAAVTILLAVPALADFTGTVVAVADGDTLTVLRGSEQVKVRFDGIDTPEKKQPFGTKAKQFTADACFGKTVTIVEKDTDRYGRTIGVVMIGGRNLNLRIVQAGYGWWYREYAPKNHELAEAEKAAREARLGLWRDENPIPPWDWRKGQRDPSPVMEADASELTHWINSSSDKRHRRRCRYFGVGDGRPATKDEGVACKVCGG